MQRIDELNKLYANDYEFIKSGRGDRHFMILTTLLNKKIFIILEEIDHIVEEDIGSIVITKKGEKIKVKESIVEILLILEKGNDYTTHSNSFPSTHPKSFNCFKNHIRNRFLDID